MRVLLNRRFKLGLLGMVLVHCIIVVVAVAFGLAKHSVAGGVQPVETLKYRYAKGRVDRYQLEIRVRSTGISAADALPRYASAAYTIEAVRPGGVGVIDAAISPAHTASERDTQLPQKLRWSSDSQGRILGSKPTDYIYHNPYALARLNLVLPDHPVRPGDRWTSTLTAAATGVTAVTVQDELFGPEPANGVKTQRIHQRVNLPVVLEAPTEDASHMKYLSKLTGVLAINAEYNFDPVAGRVVRAGVSGSSQLQFTLYRRGVAVGRPTPINLHVDVTSNLE